MRFFAIFCILIKAVLAAEIVEESVTHAGAKFRVVHLDPQQVEIVWKDANGALYRTFDQVQAAYAKQEKTVKFLMNAGIFEPGGIPSGLHIEGGKTLRPLNLADAPGNFFFKPNGVCTLGIGNMAGPFIGTCAAWQARIDLAKRKRSFGTENWGVQSGPMLLIDGQRHPAFKDGSASKLHRNGVGIDRKGQLVFAITEKGEVVNFWDLSGLFLKLGCKNALFLDGGISQTVVNPDMPVSSNLFGAMFVVVE
ncbi:MAG: phosphodiester glycosidase family protein [Luteolibacter sp.]